MLALFASLRRGLRQRAGLGTPPEQSTAAEQGRARVRAHSTSSPGRATPKRSGSSPSRRQPDVRSTPSTPGSSSEMVSLMANGGGGQYDLVSASGDADLRLIYGGDVKPINIKLIPWMEPVPPVLEEPAVQHDQREALRRVLRVRAERTALQHEVVPERHPRRGRSSTTRSTRARSRFRTTRSRSQMLPFTCRRPSRAWASPTRTN